MAKRRIPADTETFHFHNANPKGIRNGGDCTDRAIALATGIKWEKVVLVEALWAVKNGRKCCDGKDTDSLLQEFGNWVKYPMPKHADGRRYRIWELAVELEVEMKPVIVSCANHLTVIKNGKVWDTWDCGGYCVGNYWKRSGK